MINYIKDCKKEIRGRMRLKQYKVAFTPKT